MKNLLKCSNIIKVTVLMVVMVFLAAQVTVAAPTKDGAPVPGVILPAGGRTVGGPGLVNLGPASGPTIGVFHNATSAALPVCITVASTGNGNIKVQVGTAGANMIVPPGESRTICVTLPITGPNWTIFSQNLDGDDPGGSTAVYRVDLAQ